LFNHEVIYKILHKVLEKKRHGRGRETRIGFIVQAGGLCRGTPSRKLEPIAIHKLVLDIGASGKIPGRSLRNIVAGQPRKISCS
jgi:hypothetical protein